jgi:hypothetical protein
LRAAIERTFGEAGLVQRCRIHKLRNLSTTCQRLKAQVKASLNAAFKLAPRKA